MTYAGPDGKGERCGNDGSGLAGTVPADGVWGVPLLDPGEVRVPELCRFYGIVIFMFYDDHHPPHFHAVYGEYTATVEIETAEVRGGLPRRAQSLVVTWLAEHRIELLANWRRAMNRQPLVAIEPLE